MSKQQHNAFYHFMLDFRTRPGRKYGSLKEVADAAGPHWKNMPKDQRRVYEERAREAKGAATRLNSDRKPVDEIENMERQEMHWKQQMKDNIIATLSISKRRNMLNSQFFFIVHINSYCQHEHSKIYSPCEVAIAAFSLQDGVQSHNVFHAFIKPGPLPLGYAASAQQHADETHQIELPKFGDDEDNQEEIFLEIIEFLSSKKRPSTDNFPILYAAEKNLSMVNTVFETWCERFNMNINLFQIYNLQYMFRILRNTVAGNDCWTSDTMSHQEIEKDVYNYTPEIACDFHQAADVVIYCSRSLVIRYAYTICDNCCKDANIELIPGCHVPLNSKICTNAELDFKPSKSSRRIYSTKYTSDSSSIREDSSDVETVISIGKSSVWDDTSSSVSFNFPELGGRGVLGRNNSHPAGISSDVLPSQDISNSMGGIGSYAGATSLKTGSSGFSKRPAALPFNVTEELGALTISQESLDTHFPAIGVGVGRSRNPNPNSFLRGRGRGHPFKKPSSRS